ncbi:MAG: EamA family transporter [Alphaproteobacteria bacterium]|jgi:drug/metabolite transporter (DMT)-like permease|nr:EamA family transporter [Alphaproteobacteria bacterium]MBT4966849.1 EamA family transporter [Alphaproteobacteria bacterium]MBT5160721.1 EamA family transporter [Alphaproteobacteria bacterium]MBT5919016.1 EamA family transporter [Alphaproteobacteria bacterium]MBT6388037.1 EamA family transporter [Alphaproteobacteria bacterium]
MEPMIVALVLMAAVFHATWNAVVKNAGDRLVSMAVIMGMSGLMSIPLMIWLPFPDPQSWPWLISSNIIHTFYFLIVVKAYQSGGDLSQVYPISRGSSPLYVALLGAFLAGELMSTGEAVAIVVICIGILSISLTGGLSKIHREPLLWAIAIGITIGLYTFADGQGVRRTEQPLSYIAWMHFLESIPLALITLMRRRGIIMKNLKLVGKSSAIGGAMGMVGYTSVVWAMSITPMAHVAALRETSVIIAAFIGTKMLGEDGGRWRIAAAAVVALGIVGLQIAASATR